MQSENLPGFENLASLKTKGVLDFINFQNLLALLSVTKF
jgi:hypothetical protein